jgi:hypothetical protein
MEFGGLKKIISKALRSLFDSVQEKEILHIFFSIVAITT